MILQAAGRDPKKAGQKITYKRKKPEKMCLALIIFTGRLYKHISNTNLYLVCLCIVLSALSIQQSLKIVRLRN